VTITCEEVLVGSSHSGARRFAQREALCEHLMPHKHHEDKSASAKAATNIADRRSTPRQHFVAEALTVEISSGVKLSARSCDLASHGCYVDSLRPFPVGTLVCIRLKNNEAMFEANGSVAYQLPGLGMGITFLDITPESQAVLDKWLSNMPVQQDSFETLLPAIEPELPIAIWQRPTTELTVELIQVLMKKGILTKREAVGLLSKSLDK
jgi:hypothetical protein